MFSKHSKYSVTIILTQCPLPLKPRQITRLTPTQERTGHKPMENWSSCSKKHHHTPWTLSLPCTSSHALLTVRSRRGVDGWAWPGRERASEGHAQVLRQRGRIRGQSAAQASCRGVPAFPERSHGFGKGTFFYDVWRSPGLSR